MKVTDELRQQIDAKRAEMDKLEEEEKLDEAVNAADELNALIDKYKIAQAKEQADFENFKRAVDSGNVTVITPNADNTAKLRNRAFNKLVLGRGMLTDEERNAYFNVTGSPGQPALIESIDANGGYLVPQEQMKTLQEFRKAYVALKDYVSVVSTNTTSGRWATLPAQDLEFQSFAEMTDIAESDMAFGEANYVIEDRGLIIPISKQLVADADVNIIDVVGRKLAEGAVKAENKEILKPLNTLITGDTAAGITAATTITKIDDLNAALFKTLDSTYYPSARIFTNQDGFLWLANLIDANNRPLFVPDVTEPDKYRYRGKEIVVVPNGTLPSATSGSNSFAPFFIGDFAAYLTFFERQGMELATSSELYFRKFGLALRAVIRFGVVVTDKDAMTALKVKV